MIFQLNFSLNLPLLCQNKAFLDASKSSENFYFGFVFTGLVFNDGIIWQELTIEVEGEAEEAASNI